MAMKVVIVGATLASAEELKNIVVATIGSNSEIEMATIDNFKEFREADIYVCLINRRQEVENVFGAEKVVALELLPPTDYFIKICFIPANSSVIVFNNTTAGTKTLMDCLTRYNLTHVNYEVVPYDEWSEQQVAQKISTAKYITGGITHVGEDRPLYTKFRAHIPKDVTIIASPLRIATSESISWLSRVYASLYHERKMQEQKQIEEALLQERDALKLLVAQIQQTVAHVTLAASEILASSTQMATITEEQAVAVNEITTTTQEIKASAELVAQHAQSVAESAAHAAEAARKGIEAVTGTTAGMGEIRQKVEVIAANILALSEQTAQAGNIVDTVTDIAGQSNILALNAAIEAAHAGEVGERFRVVADEVKALAEQSRQAAKEVKGILGDIQKAANQAVSATQQGTQEVSAGSALVSKTEQTINTLAQMVEAAAQAAEQIVTSVYQQTIGLDQIVVGMKDINQAAQQSAAGAQRSREAAETLTKVAEELKGVVGRY